MPDTKAQITDGFTANMAKVDLPVPVKNQLQQDFTDKQNNYSDKLVNAFSKSLHTIFVVTSSMMLLALVLTIALKERPLRMAKPTETPGEA
jgi:hypothetical protein